MPYTLVFIVITNVDVMVAESTEIAQVEDPVASISAEDNAVQTSAGEPVLRSLLLPLLLEGYHDNDSGGVSHNLSID